MLLDPGPIPAIAYPTQDTTADPETFTDVVNAELGPLPGLEDDLDATIDPTALVDPVTPDDGVGPVLDGLTADLTVQSALPGGGLGNPAEALGAEYDALAPADYKADTDHIDVLMAGRAAQMVNVYDVTPGEAFYPVPESLGGFDPNAPYPGSTTVGTKIENLSRPGAADFWPGDQYKITVTIGPVPGGGSVIQGVEIIAYPWQNDVVVPNIDFGSTDANGILCMAGIWGLDAPGDWGMTIYQHWPDGKILAGDTIHWTVSPLPLGNALPQTALNLPRYVGFTPTQCQGSPPPSSTVTVSLANVTNPGSPDYAVGDSWVLTVTGEALQVVEISALQNGNALPWEQLGQTDDQGVFVLNGSVPDDTYIGAWSEFYQVGSVRWQGSLDFNVTPAGGPNVTSSTG